MGPTVFEYGSCKRSRRKPTRIAHQCDYGSELSEHEESCRFDLCQNGIDDSGKKFDNCLTSMCGVPINRMTLHPTRRKKYRMRIVGVKRFRRPYNRVDITPTVGGALS